MTIAIQGFFEFSSLIDNTPDTVAPFGEISDHALTYAKDKTYHDSEATPQTRLIVFHSVDDETPVVAAQPLVESVLKVGQYLLDRALAGQITTDPNIFLRNLQAEFGDDVTDVDCGTLLTEDNLRLPEWISFVDHSLDPGATVKVWLADTSFRNQYNEYIIEVLPPIKTLDDFFRDPLDVKERLDAYQLNERLEDAQRRRGDYPYTELQALEFDYHDPKDETYTLPTQWLVLIYGQAGSNLDVVKNAITEKVLADSTHNREEWTVILPDLFTTTEFILTPFWNNYSVPNRELQAGIYSPTVQPQLAEETTVDTVQGAAYTEEWIREQWELSGVFYKSLAFSVVGNPQNRDGVVRFSKQFPDYMLVANNSADFNRMNVVTQEFQVMLAELIKLAESSQATSTLPTGYSRLTRKGVNYITRVFNNVAYLVVTKASLTRLNR